MRQHWKSILLASLTAILLLGLLTAGASAAGFEKTRTYTPGQFTDVPANAWYAESVKTCYELGLIQGSSPTTFNPNGTLTVAEVLTLAARLHSIYNGGDGVIPPAEGFWFQGAVNYCLEKGIITPSQFTYYTGRADRAETVGILAAALPDGALPALNQVEALPDVHMTTPYRKEIFAFYEAGIVTGSDSYGMFHPYTTISRAEVAALLVRIADPAMRKTFALLPVTEWTSAVSLPVKSVTQLKKMSGGMLAYQSEKGWGYLNDVGKVVIPAQYFDVGEFRDGLAIVSNRKNGFSTDILIDTAGRSVLPEHTNSASWGKGAYRNISYCVDGIYMIKESGGPNGLNETWFYADGQLKNWDYDSLYILDNGGRGGSYATYQDYECPNYYTVIKDRRMGVIDRSGKELVPVTYLLIESIYCNGRFFIAEKKDGSADVYSLKGEFLGSFDEVEWQNGDYFLGGKIGEKYAIISTKGVLTEAIFDQVMVDWSNEHGVTARIGYETALYGPDGEVIIPMGKYGYGRFSILEDCIRCEKDVYVNGRYDRTEYHELNLNGDYVNYWDDRKIEYVVDGYSVARNGAIYDANGTLIRGAKILDGVPVQGYFNNYNNYYYRGMNGKYGVYNTFTVYTDPIYDTSAQANEAAWDYVPGQFLRGLYGGIVYKFGSVERPAYGEMFGLPTALGEDCFAVQLKENGPLCLVYPRYPQ